MLHWQSRLLIFMILFVIVFIWGRASRGDQKAGEALFTAKKCAKCHGQNGTGGKIGPNISHIASGKSREELITWLTDPQALKPETKMPKPRVSKKEMEDLLDYLQTFK